MRSQNRIIFLCSFFLTLSASLLAQSVDVDYDHWIYDFITRMESKGVYTKFDAGIKPYSRTEIANIIMQIDSVANTEPGRLSKSEKGLLEQFKGEFADELAGKNLKINSKYNERHALRWQEGENRVYFDLGYGQILDFRVGDQYDDPQRDTELTLGAQIRGQFGPKFSFFLDVRNTASATEDDSLLEHFDPSQGQPVVNTGSTSFSDKAVAYFKWQLPWFSLKFGRDRLKWGPGYRGGVVLSQNNPLFDMILLQTRFYRFNYQYFHGFLNSSFEQKYLAAHRLEFKATDWLYLSGSETVIYGNRNVEMQYLNPIMPYHVAEHHMGDKDNNMMGFDISAFPVKNQKYYFELLLDDFSSSENWFKYIGNKFAFMFGGYWVEPFGLRDFDIRAEYTRVEPFVYTHYDSVNIYMNYDQGMGYWTGPNSDNLFLEINYWPYKDVHLSFSWEQVRRSEGDLYNFPTKEDGLEKFFLAEPVEKQHIYKFGIQDQLFKDVFLAFNGVMTDSKNLFRIPGNNSLDKQFVFKLAINY